MIGNSLFRIVRPGVTALLRSSVVQQPSLACANVVCWRDYSVPGSNTPILASVSRNRNSSLVHLAKNASTATGEHAHKHAGHFKLERYWAVGMLPLFPAAYFIHGPVMDYALAVAVCLHIHWGFFGVVQDYARPFLLGETLSKMCVTAIYVITALMLAGLIHFNYNDVGLTKAFELVWDL